MNTEELKNWYFWTVVLEKTLESPMDCKQIKPVNSKINQSWIFFGRTDAEAETLVLQPPDAKNWLIGKDPDAKKDWRQEETGMTEDETVGWHYWLNGHEFEQVLGVGEGQGSLVYCSPWGGKKSDTTEQLNWIFKKFLPNDALGISLKHVVLLFGLFFIAVDYGNIVCKSLSHFLKIHSSILFNLDALLILAFLIVSYIFIDAQ